MNNKHNEITDNERMIRAIATCYSLKTPEIIK